MKNRKGFTLIELLGVILILALLLLLVIPNITKYLKSGTLNYYTSIEKEMKVAGMDYLETYRTLLPKQIGNVTVIDIKELINNKYIDPVKDEKGILCEGQVVIRKKKKDSYDYYSCLSCGENGKYYETDEKIKLNGDNLVDVCSIDESGNTYPNSEDYTIDPNVCTDISNCPIEICDEKGNCTSNLCDTEGCGSNTCDCSNPSSCKTRNNKMEINFSANPVTITVEQGSGTIRMPVIEGWHNSNTNVKTNVIANPSTINTNKLGITKVTYNFNGQKRVFNVKVVDTTRPSTPSIALRHGNITGSVYTSEWTSSNIYATFRSTDNFTLGLSGSGIKSYKLADNAQMTSPITLTYPINNKIFDTEGKHTIYVQSVDKNGIDSCLNQFTYKIDKTAPNVPTINVDGYAEEDGYSSNINITLVPGTDKTQTNEECNENTCSRIYDIDNSIPIEERNRFNYPVSYELSGVQTTSTVFNNTVTITQLGETTITAYTYDKAGNKSSEKKITVKKIPDTSLKSLAVSGGCTLTPTFNKNVLTGYTCEVPYAVSSVTITAEVTDPANVRIDSGTGTTTLSNEWTFGCGVIHNPRTITVKTKDGRYTKKYEIDIQRKEPEHNAYLKSLAISGYQITPTVNTSATQTFSYGTFNKDTLSYTISQTLEHTKVNVAAATESTLATVSGTGSKTLGWIDSSHPTISTSVTVTAQDGVTKKTYTVYMRNVRPTPPTLKIDTYSWGVNEAYVSGAGSAITGVKTYEYYLTSGSPPNDGTAPTGSAGSPMPGGTDITNTESTLTPSRNIAYYRTVSNGGSRSAWSTPVSMTTDGVYLTDGGFIPWNVLTSTYNFNIGYDYTVTSTKQNYNCVYGGSISKTTTANCSVSELNVPGYYYRPLKNIATSYGWNIQKLKIPSSVTRIGNAALACVDMTTGVEMPGVTSIGRQAFLGSDYPITVSDKVYYVGKFAFSDQWGNCRSSPSLLTDTNYIKSRNVTFQNQTNWYSYTDLFGDSDPPFYAALGGTNIDINVGDSVLVYRSPAFDTDVWYVRPGAYNEDGYHSRHVGDNEFNTGRFTSGTLMKYTSYSYYVVSEGTWKIPTGAFEDNTYLKRIVLPKSVEVIEFQAFKGCTSLTNVKMNSGRLTKIDSKAFYDTTSLTSITIPSSVDYIGAEAFGRSTKNKFVCGKDKSTGVNRNIYFSNKSGWRRIKESSATCYSSNTCSSKGDGLSSSLDNADRMSAMLMSCKSDYNSGSWTYGNYTDRVYIRGH